MTSATSLVFSAEEAYRQYFDRLLAGDRDQCCTMFVEWVELGVPLRELYQNVIQRSLYEIGKLWQRGQISMAVEHLSSAITESLLNLVYPLLLAQPRVGKSAVVACIAGDRHQIGARMVADFFELKGWRSHFCGANTPLDTVQSLVEDKRPNVLALSITVEGGMETLEKAARELRKAFSDLPILVGGQGLRTGAAEAAMSASGVRYLGSLSALEAWIDKESRND